MADGGEERSSRTRLRVMSGRPGAENIPPKEQRGDVKLIW